MDPYSAAERRGRAGKLTGRDAERGALDRVVDAVRAGESRVLVMRGDPGVGKTVLLDYLAGSARGCRVARAAGVQSEMELAFAGLHQLCAPMTDRLEKIPEPQREALRTAFGLAAGPPPGRFLVGLALLSLLSEVAGDQPLVCVIDDVQWLDQASEQALGFVARRLAADPVALVFAARELGGELAGQPELVIEGLRDVDARRLLDSALPGPLDTRVRDLIVAETRGNPLALLQLPRGLTPAELAGGFGLLGARPGADMLTRRIEESFAHQLDALPAPSRQLMLLAAADPSGDGALILRAAGQLGLGVEASRPAVEAGLVEFAGQVRFRHPLVRSAAYRSASPAERQQLHAALAEMTDPQSDPDRRAWHLAHATADHDEDVAAELERSAGRAQARGGLAAAAAFLERAALLSDDPARRVGRALAGALAKIRAGAPEAGRALLDIAEAGPLGDLERGRLELIRARMTFANNRNGQAALLLLRAAQRLERIDISLAREAYLDAMAAAIFAGRLASPGASTFDVASAAAAVPLPARPRPQDLLLDGMVALYTQGYAAALPRLRQGVAAAGDSTPADAAPHWLWLACAASSHTWDDARWESLSRRYLQLIRHSGALAELPLASDRRVRPLVFAGELTAAADLLDETRTVVAATGEPAWPYGELSLAAFRGDEPTVVELIGSTMSDVTRRGEGFGITCAEWASSVLNNSLGRSHDALAAAQRATAYDGDLGFSKFALVELIEAAVHCGMPERAAGAYRRLTAMTEAAGTDWALGVTARSRALLNDDEDAYQEAVERLGRTRLRVELARTHLLYGEWLRRAQRRRDARTQLRTAYQMLDTMGVAAFAERARRELNAVGETVRARSAETANVLTPQEAYIARLARDGRTNAEIGAELFLSARTIEWHLRKVFPKLGITSRRELHAALES